MNFDITANLDGHWLCGGKASRRDFSRRNQGSTSSAGSLPFVISERGMVYDFNGTDSKVTIPSNAFNTFGDSFNDRAFSVAAWVNLDAITNQRILCKRANSTDEAEWTLLIDSADKLAFSVYDSGVSIILRSRKCAVLTGRTGEWLHCVGTYDGRGGTNAQDGIEVYVNGINKSDSTQSLGTYTAMHDTGANVTIGHLEVGSTYGDGRIQDVRIYGDHALSEAEVFALYSETRRDPTGRNRAARFPLFARYVTPSGHPWHYYAQQG